MIATEIEAWLSCWKDRRDHGAIRLASKGIAPEEIAVQLNTPLPKIRKWVSMGKTGEQDQAQVERKGVTIMSTKPACKAQSVGGAGRMAVIYARVRSKDQEREGFSIPAQLELLRTYAATKGLTVAEEFIDVETAKQAGRGAFGRMIAHAKQNAMCRDILVEKTDRLYRNFKDYVTIDELGADIHLVEENVILSPRRAPPRSSCTGSRC